MSPSNISLFVSNLRLLNLDQRQDWPDITEQTFDTKDALQNQKKRVSCTEWSLYHLFGVWDKDTTREKLQPFFPPLEPIQSLNLRAALFRCLNELKKNDVLGREATLRKTMLDDCKGDKFEEILLLFSAAVVRKQILSTRRKQPLSIGRSIALAKNIDKRELSTIVPLSLAYCASLAKTLQSRATLDLTLDNFRTSLYEKTNDYHQRHITLLEMQEATTDMLPADAETLIRRELRQNWVGSIEGCDALLAGAKVASADAHMDSSFDDLWQHIRQGTLSRVPSESVSLLATLQSRVVEQNDRLRLWKTYKEVFEETNKPADSVQDSALSVTRNSTAKSDGLDVFNKHKNIDSGQTSSDIVEHSTSESSMEYNRVVQDMKQNLLDVVRTKKWSGQASYHAAPPSAGMVRRANTILQQASIPVFLGGARGPKEDLFSPLKQPLLESANSTPVSTRNERHETHDWLSRTHSQPLATPQSVRTEYGLPSGSAIRSSQGSALGQPDFAEPSPSVQKDRERYVKAHIPSSLRKSEATPISNAASPGGIAYLRSANSGHNGSAEDPVITLEHRIDEITLEERQRSSPSPELPEYPPQVSRPSPAISRSPERPDLSERARLSMASFSSSSSSRLLPQSAPGAPTSSMDSDAALTQSRRVSLADRALASMNQASLHPPPQRCTTTKERPKSAFFPSNAAQFSTPMKASRSSLGGTRDTTPRDKLFEQDAEYASVFKSRPKIAMSPVLSPELDLQMEEAEEFSFEGDVENEESMMRLESSPLGKFGM
ncbi:hypothetical protein KCU62_g8431, partial [Aureobasidium sp. EXF-3399]